jgi:hypothetical protein
MKIFNFFKGLLLTMFALGMLGLILMAALVIAIF